LVAILMQVFDQELLSIGVEAHWNLVIGVGITTVGWITVTLLTQPESEEVLRSFAARVSPTYGWKKYRSEGGTSSKLPIQILGMFLGCTGVYTALFGTGSLLYGNVIMGAALLLIAVVSLSIILLNWKRF